MENYCYSYYAARKGIDPVFVFKHHLTKLDFYLKPRYNPMGTRKVKINKIELRTKYKAQFTVADRGSADNLGLLFDDDEYKDLPLRDEGKEGLVEGKYEVETLKTEEYNTDLIPVGTSLLVAPADSYEAYAYLTEIFPDGEKTPGNTGPLKMELTNPEGFLPGNSYNINVSVYGANRVEVQVELAEWKSGGKVVIDNEDAFGNNGEL